VNKIDADRSWTINTDRNRIDLVLDSERSRPVENFSKIKLIIVKNMEYSRNNSSFEMPKGRLSFGIQNISMLDDTITIRIPAKQTKTTKRSDLKNPELSCSFLLLVIF
jgi:hypothetical protein